MIRTYSELIKLNTFEERYKYLALGGRVGDMTFGYDRWINQKFYTSTQWRRLRSYIIVRDNNCDLGVEGFDIPERLYIHHLNPMTVDDIREGDESILDPEFLITTTLLTHNAIHYGDTRVAVRSVVERKPGDTKLW